MSAPSPAAAGPDRSPHYFGIRHHGPGCARSLVRAFDALKPDCVLIEGPPEADALLPWVTDEGMRPPVALLSYCPDEPGLAVYHPFAVFSPEWQAARWAVSTGVPVRFMDLPVIHGLALARERLAALPASPDANPGPDDPARPETSRPERDEAPKGQRDEGPNRDGDELPNREGDELPNREGDELPNRRPDDLLSRDDPLNWLARAAGFADGEAWWNHLVEERGDGTELFAAIDEAMKAVREQWGERPPGEADASREAAREAFMRQRIREARKEGFERIAVVCGAWHLPALQADLTARHDKALLKGLPRVKVQSTWVPWTYRHLARASGYGAGIEAPGWYEHLWHCQDNGQPRAIAWLARVARLMRERDLDCASAHLIEAARLADALAALRNRPAPGLAELHEASRTVLTLGDEAALGFIHDALVVGDRLGAVPPEAPTVPLQRDFERCQKAVRLKPEATHRSLDLDLRAPNDLARSHLLHRMALLDLPWGTVSRTGRSARGTFHEIWALQWKPEFALRLIEASQWGQTLIEAATARVADRCARARTVSALSALVDQVLLADLDGAVDCATRALQDRAAVTGDVRQLLAGLPPLSNIFRYGNARQTDATLVAPVLDGLILRAAIGLPLACTAIDDGAAEALRSDVLGAHAAVGLRDAPAQTASWRDALARVATHDLAHTLLKGIATRLLLDDGVWSADEAARCLSLHLSSGADPGRAAAWLDGFLNRNAAVLLHDDQAWQLVDDWLGGLSDAHFIRVLPLLRRTFATFGSSEHRDLGQRARRGRRNARGTAASATEPDWDEARALLALPVLGQILGIRP